MFTRSAPALRGALGLGGTANWYTKIAGRAPPLRHANGLCLAAPKLTSMGINNHECRRLLSTTPTSKPKVAVVYYSMYGHVRTLAVEEKKGLEAAGCEAILLQVPETLTEDILTKMGAPPKADDLIANPFELADYDGILFGVPTRFGMAAAQMKAFLDATGSLWQKGALYGKPAGIFFSTATLGGGQETTALTFLTQLSHHGMIYVPIGPSSPLIFDLTEPHGGSAYGAGTLAGPDGSRVPLELECKLAAHQGEQFGMIVKKLIK